MAEQNRASTDMCEHCFDALIHELKRKPIVVDSNTSNNAAVLLRDKHLPKGVGDEEPPLYPCNERFPLFVTWKKRPSILSSSGGFKLLGGGSSSSSNSSNNHHEEEYHLRGCIGTFSPLSLSSALKQYALIAAFKDSRFDPIIVDEVPQLKCNVSLLVDFEDLETGNAFDWQVGTHGIRIRFDVNGKNYSGTYLPEVAKEQEWNQEETIQSLIRKTGYKGKITESLLDAIESERYQSSKASLTYDEYLQEKLNSSNTRKVDHAINTSRSLSSVNYDFDD